VLRALPGPRKFRVPSFHHFFSQSPPPLPLAPSSTFRAVCKFLKHAPVHAPSFLWHHLILCPRSGFNPTMATRTTIVWRTSRAVTTCTKVPMPASPARTSVASCGLFPRMLQAPALILQLCAFVIFLSLGAGAPLANIAVVSRCCTGQPKTFSRRRTRVLLFPLM
jgi:hypothetical protein